MIKGKYLSEMTDQEKADLVKHIDAESEKKLKKKLNRTFHLIRKSIKAPPTAFYKDTHFKVEDKLMEDILRAFFTLCKSDQEELPPALNNIKTTISKTDLMRDILAYQ